MSLPSETTLINVTRRVASLLDELASELGERPLVLPTPRFFPDVYAADRPSVCRLLARMQEQAGMTDVPIQVRLVEDSAGVGGCGGCGCAQPTPAVRKSRAERSDSCQCGDDCQRDGHGPCGDDCRCKTSSESNACSCSSPHTDPGDDPENMPRLVDLGDGWRLQVPQSELAAPVVLTTNLARALGYVFLLETRSSHRPLREPIDVTAELTSCLLGFGALMLAGSHIYGKSCRGPSIRRVTALGCPELALATALFVVRGNHDSRPLRRELQATQLDAYRAAERWIGERPTLKTALRQDPHTIAVGQFEFNPPRPGLWARWFGRPRQSTPAPDETEASLDELEALLAETPLSTRAAARRSARHPQDDELRALVEESLGRDSSTESPR